MGEIEKSHTFIEPRKKEETECLDVWSSSHLVYSQALEGAARFSQAAECPLQVQGPEP